MFNINVSTLPLGETADNQAATNLSDGVCPILGYREAFSDNSEELETARMEYIQALQDATIVPFQTVKGRWNSNRSRPPKQLPRIVMSLTQNNRKTTLDLGFRV
jgi:hypothetical protein